MAVRRRTRRQLRLRPQARFLWTVALLFGLAVWLISRYAALYGLGQEVMARQQRLAQLQTANEHLAIEVAQRDTLPRLEQAARSRGFVSPERIRMAAAPAGDHQGEAGAQGASQESPPQRTTVVRLEEPQQPAPAGQEGAAERRPLWRGLWERLRAALAGGAGQVVARGAPTAP